MKKYLSFFRLRFAMGLQYRTAALAGGVTQFVWGFMQIMIYKAFYQADASAFPMSFSATASYIWLQQAFLAFFAAWMMENEIIQVLGSKFELTRFGRMLQAVVMFVYGIAKSEVVWDYKRVFTIVFMLVGGTAVFAGLFLIYAALCFFTLDGLEFMNVFTDGAREFVSIQLEFTERRCCCLRHLLCHMH